MSKSAIARRRFHRAKTGSRTITTMQECAAMKKQLKPAFAAVIAFFALTGAAFLYDGAALWARAAETYSLSDVTDDMLTDIDGVPTYSIVSDGQVQIICDGQEHEFALDIDSAGAELVLTDDSETTLLAVKAKGDLNITGGMLTIRGDGTALDASGGNITFSDCKVIAKSLKGIGARLNGATVGFDSGGRFTVTGAASGVLADGGSAINVLNGGVFKAYSVHSFAVTLKDASFSIPEGGQGKIFLGGNLRAVSGDLTIGSDALVIGDPARDASCFIVTRGEKIKIALDPGHGGRDPGAVYAAEQYAYGSADYNFYLEKNLSLKVAQYLKQELSSSQYIDVIMTRDSDEYLDMADRVKAAYMGDADVLISIHFNYDPAHILEGASMFISQFDRYRLDGLGELILGELSELGLETLGPLVRLDTDYDGDDPAWWDMYDNVRTDEVDTGVFCDYYGMVNGPGRMFMFPLLIEHLHLSDRGDMEIIADESGLEAIAKADADAILSYFKCGDVIEGGDIGDYCRALYKEALALGDESVSLDIAGRIAEYMTNPAVSSGDIEGDLREIFLED